MKTFNQLDDNDIICIVKDYLSVKKFDRNDSDKALDLIENVYPETKDYRDEILYELDYQTS